jgi:hypothetical protein
MTETVQGLEEGAPVQTNQGPEGRPLNVSPARKGWVWSFYISRDQANGISTTVAVLDAEFWLCIRARL